MAQTMSVDDVLRHIRKASLFIEGITVSGGEATTQLPFTKTTAGLRRRNARSESLEERVSSPSDRT